MLRSKRFRNLLPVLMTLILTGSFSGEAPSSSQGTSPYYSAASQLEEFVFFKIHKKYEHQGIIREGIRVAEEEARRLAQIQYENRIKAKIRRVMADYRYRMSAKHLRQIPEWILAESKTYGYDPMFLTALIITESSFNNRARSHRGAMGLMQILPGTGRAMATETQVKWEGSPTLYNPEINIALGAYYLNKLLSRFGDLNLALEAYNHGPTRLDKYLKRGVKPRHYSQKVFAIYEMIDFEPT